MKLLRCREKIYDLEKSQYDNEKKMFEKQNELEAAIIVEQKERGEERQKFTQELKVCLQIYTYLFTYIVYEHVVFLLIKGKR